MADDDIDFTTLHDKPDRPEFIFTEGYKDEYKFIIQADDWEWAPYNEEQFEMIRRWFIAESAGYSGDDNYGHMWPLFYTCLIALGENDAVASAIGAEGGIARTMFEVHVQEYGDDIIQMFEDLQTQVEA